LKYKRISNAEKTDLKMKCMNLIKTDLHVLEKEATALRTKNFGNTIDLCSVVNAKSGKCSEDCKYCAQSAHYTTDVECYPLIKAEDIYKGALKAASAGINNFGIVTSGPGLTEKDLDQICEAVEKISRNGTISPCASLGRLTMEQFKKLKNSGLNRYHHNLETSERFYSEICTTHSWEERVETVLLAKEAGFAVCSGGLFGLGENWEDRIDLAIKLKELDVDCVPINFLNAIPGTPMAVQEKLTPDEALKIVALYRYILPDKTVRVCGGRPTILKERQSEMYNAGANAIMTGDYLTSYGISPELDIKNINDLGLKVRTIAP
jgi:biotin synthase